MRLLLWRSPVFWLGAVVVLYALWQWTTMDLGRFLAWDEAIYTSEVSRFADAIFLDAHRARGVTFVVAPIAQVTDSILALRFYLVLVSAGGLFIAFLPWVQVMSWAAPVAAALFGSSWLTVFYGSEVMPNLYAAFAAVCALGLAIGFTRDRSQIQLVGLGLAVATLAFIRPLDAGTTVAAIVVMAFIMRGQGSWRALAFAIGGFALGMFPWLIESWVRFGGPIARLERTRELVGGGFQSNLIEYLRLSNGPISGPDPSSQIAWPMVVWLGLLLMLGVGSFVTGVSHSRRVGATALSSSLLLALPYLVLSQAAAPRFMLPGLALLAVAASLGLLAISRAVASSRAVPLILVAMLTLAFLNAGPLTTNAAMQSESRARGRLLAESLDSRSSAGSCFFLSPSGFPQLAFASGCRGNHYSGDISAARPRIEEAMSQGLEVFLVLNDPQEVEALENGWKCDLIEELATHNWHICQA